MNHIREQGPVRIGSRSPFTGGILRCDLCWRELDILKACLAVVTKIGKDDFVWKQFLPGEYCPGCANQVGAAASEKERASVKA